MSKMKRNAGAITRRRAVAVLAAGVAASAGYSAYRSLRGPRSTPAPTFELEGATRERLQVLLDELMTRPGIHHAIVAVEGLDTASRWVGVAGDARPGGPPMTHDTPFHLASITKLFTSVAVLRMHERGLLGLETSIAEYLPRSLIEGIHRRGGVDRSPAITVRNLLAHTSGLADYFTDRPRGGVSLSARLAAEGDFGWTLEELLSMVRHELDPHFPPQAHGEGRQKVRYSDTNYQLLGAILAAVGGKPLEDVFEDELFEPLRLENSWLYPHERVPRARAVTLMLGDEPWDVPQALASVGPDGGMVSTVDDAFAFLRALMAGAAFEDPRTLALMQEEWNRFGLPLDPAALQLPSWPIEYGLGIMRFRLPAFLNRFRPMPALLGHTGSTGSWLFHCPELGVMLAGTVNQATAGALPYRFLPKLLRVLDGRDA